MGRRGQQLGFSLPTQYDASHVSQKGYSVEWAWQIFSGQPTFINVGCPHHTFCMGRNYFANYFDFKNNFSPYKLYGGNLHL